MTLVPLDQHDPRLRQVCAPITKSQLRLKEQQAEIDALLGYVYGASNKRITGVDRDKLKPSTIGLSANQVGIMKQITVVDLSIGHRGYTDLHILVNPKISWRSKAVITKPEGCVNFMTTWGVTERARTIKVEALDRSGNEITLKVTGWPAVLLQHEIDHLNGHLFIDRLLEPGRAHQVSKDEYPEYRKHMTEWEKYVDVADQVAKQPKDLGVE